MKINPETCLDAYKIGHKNQLVPGIELSLGNMTPRKSYREHTPKGVVWMGLQYFLKRYLIDEWNKNFFQKPKDEVLARYTRRINNYLGPNDVGNQHISDLHDLGHLPLCFYSLPEGSVVPYKVPPVVYWTTDKRFAWLQAYVETIMSATIWPISTSATTAKEIKDILSLFAKDTVGSTDFVKFQGHNFSYRGCMGHEAAIMVDAGFLSSFVGSDTVPGTDFMEEYYNADSDKELVACSVNASEHAVMASYGEDNEFEAFRRLIEEVYPRGILSIVSDTRDYWKVISEYAVTLKDSILQRDGKTVFRPDSGDNVKIIIGDPEAQEGSPQFKGTIEMLWDIYGGTINEKGYKELNPKVGAILGDGVNHKVMFKICEGLKNKGFASTNIVFGVGSYYLVYGVSRDTDGWAVKSTYCEVNGVPREIFKDPITDTGNLKKSAKGLTAVFKDENGEFYLKDQATWDEVRNCEFIPVFKDGQLLKDYTLSEVRENLAKFV